MSAQPLVAFFKDIDKSDLSSVGGKGANLGEMTKAGFPVPAGFAITVLAYDKSLEENNLSLLIRNILKKAFGISQARLGSGQIVRHRRGPARDFFCRTAGDFPEYQGRGEPFKCRQGLLGIPFYPPLHLLPGGE